jgi:hypothetical protein
MAMYVYSHNDLRDFVPAFLTSALHFHRISDSNYAVQKETTREEPRDCAVIGIADRFNDLSMSFIGILYYKVKVKLSLCLTKHHTMKTYLLLN